MRHPHFRIVAGIAVTIAATALLASCAAKTDSATGSRKDTVIIGTGATPQSLDPILGSDVQTDFTDGAIYDKLVDYDAEGKLIPQLATAWEFNADATSVTLTLRDDVVFHSGTKLTAKDVVYTLERDKSLGLGVASFISLYTGSTAVDDTHVKIDLASTNSTFVGALSKIYVVDSALVEKNAGSDDAQAWLASNDAGSGPYRLTGYTANQQASLERFDTSWRFDADRPKNLVYRYISDSSTLRDELKAGGVDVVTGLNPTDLAALKSDSSLQQVVLPSALQTYVMMNTQSGVTADPRVREAIQLAYDYTGHISSILGGAGKVATGIVAPTVGCRVDAGASKQDVAAAKKLIAEAGVGGETLTLAYQSTIPEQQKAATLMQSDLKAIGLNVELKTVTYPEYMAMIGKPETVPALAVLWDFPYYPEIGPMLYRVYDSKFIGQTNYSLFSDPKVDSLLEAGLADTDTTSACDDFTQAQKLILAARASVNISNPVTTTVVRKGIGGIAYDPTYQLFNPTMLTVGH